MSNQRPAPSTACYLSRKWASPPIQWATTLCVLRRGLPAPADPAMFQKSTIGCSREPGISKRLSKSSMLLTIPMCEALYLRQPCICRAVTVSPTNRTCSPLPGSESVRHSLLLQLTSKSGVMGSKRTPVEGACAAAEAAHILVRGGKRAVAPRRRGRGSGGSACETRAGTPRPPPRPTPPSPPPALHTDGGMLFAARRGDRATGIVQPWEIRHGPSASQQYLPRINARRLCTRGLRTAKSA